MEKRKKFIVILLIFIILISQIEIVNFFNLSKVYAVTDSEWNSYFYSQLTPNAKGIYDAMSYMYKNKIFIKGDSMEITDRVTSSSIALFVNGNNQLIDDYGAARDAFQYDNPDCFYIDWDQLSVRVNQDSAGKLHAFLGAGRSDTYLLKGMDKNRTNKANGGYGKGIEGAIAQYEAKITEVVNNIKNNAKSESDEIDKNVKMLGEAHDYVTLNMEYKHEWETTPPNTEEPKMKSTSRTAYDGLIYGQGVCEAYTRTFKAICDRLKIPCVCVYGVYSPKTTINEPHIWNYVQINEKWYGVDVTHDDPTVMNGLFIYGTNENRDFFLVGQNQLAAHHFPQGIMSSANYEFKYPTLEEDAYRESYSMESGDGFSIVVEKDSQLDNWNGNQAFDSGTFYVSYEGMNFSQNAARGKYMLAKYYNYNPGTDTWDISDWSYIDPWLVLYNTDDRIEEIEPKSPKNGKYCTRIELAQTKKVQFAITETPPAYLEFRKELETKGYTDDLSNRLFNALANGAAYLKDGGILSNTTAEIENKWGDYVSPPIPTECTPKGCLYIGQTHHLKMKFNDKLKLESKNATVGIDMSVNGGAGIAGNWNAGHSALENAKISNIKWDGDRVVEFDFTPSDKYADNSVFYNFQVTGLIGNSSNRKTVASTYAFRYPCACYAYAAQGYNRNVYAQPQLMETSDMDISNWELEDVDTHSEKYGKKETMSQFMDEIAKNNGSKQEFLDSLHARLTLVTTEPAPAQEKAMEKILDENKNKSISNDYDKAIKDTINTYNISITVCKKQVLRTGESVRIALGFPKGTTYEDYAENGRLSFKAYHYLVDPETDKLTGDVEELCVTVTRQGLVLWVDSFSPFTVMAIENDEPVKIKEKELLVTSTLGGAITDKNNNKLEKENADIKLKVGESKTLKIVPEKDYEIDYIMINDIRQNITNKSEQEIEISYDTIETGSVLNVGFVAKEIHEKEKAKNLSSSFEVPTIQITMPDGKDSFKFLSGNEVQIPAVVTVTGRDFNPVDITKEPNFDPEEEKKKINPRDYLVYEWFSTQRRTLGGGAAYDYIVGGDGTTPTLKVYNPSYIDTGYYFLKVTPMKWNYEKENYEVMNSSTGDIPASVYSNMIYIEFLNQIQFDLKTDLKLTKVNNNNYAITLKDGDTYNIFADIWRQYRNTDYKISASRPITWESSNDSIVTISQDGYLKVVKYSNEPVTITGTLTDIDDKTQKNVTITVTIEKIPVDTITIASSSDKLKNGVITLEKDEQIPLYAEIAPINASNKKVTWRVSEGADEYIQISDDGIVTAKKITENIDVKVIAIVDNKQTECKVNVIPTEVTEISDNLDDNNIYLVEPSVNGAGKNTSVKVSVNVLPDNATNKKVIWSTSDDTVAKVTQDGVITAVADLDDEDSTRECTITVKSESNPNVKNKYFIHVAENITDIESVEIAYPEGEDTELILGESLDLNVKINPKYANVKEVIWDVIEGNDVVNVSNSGHVHSLKVGTAKVKVVVKCQVANCKEEHTATIEIKVNPVPPIEVKSITIEQGETISIRKGTETKLNAIIEPNNATNKTVIWSSNKEDIVSVASDGTIKANKVGTATITAKSGSETDSIEVTVEPVNIKELIIEDYIKMKDNDDPITMKVDYYPENADNVEFIWSSSDENVVTVENGTIIPHNAGSAIVKVAVKGNEEIYRECEVIVVPSVTDVTVYTIDQNKNFIDGITLRLSKLNEDGIEVLLKENSSNGKFEFKNLENGEYILRVVDVPKKDPTGKDLNFTNIVDCKFEINDGKIIFESENDIFNEIPYLVLINTTDGSESKAENGENYPNIDKEYEEFVKNLSVKPGDEPTKPENKPNTQTNPNDDTDISAKPDNNINSDADEEKNNNGRLPSTSDIAIGTFGIIMIISLIGIIYIFYKKSKN